MNDKNIYFETYGCTMNQSDTEYLMKTFIDAGYTILPYEESHFVVINTCGVKRSTEDKIIARLRELSKTHKKVIITGCLSKINLDAIKRAIPNFCALFGTNIERIHHNIEKIEKGVQVIDISDEKDEKICSSYYSTSLYRSIVSISEGCVGDCSFCCTKNARGSITSYQKEKIVQRIKNDLSIGKKEFYITAQDVSAYGIDTKSSLYDLIKEILDLDGEYRIRLGMMNPNTLRPQLDKVIELFLDHRIYKFFHIPLQSGSDRILGLMRRKYTKKDYIRIIEKIKSYIPSATIWTDVIVGFPSETDHDFEETLDIIKKTRPHKINISKYGKRPNTLAAVMEQVSPIIVKKRVKELSKLYRESTENINLEYLHKEIEVLFTEKKEKYYGRSNEFSRVIADSAILGKVQFATIKKVDRLNLFS